MNRINVLSSWKDEDIRRIFRLEKDEVKKILEDEPFIPLTEQGKKAIDILTTRCVELALDRHVGDLRRVFTTNGYKVIPDGKDTTQVKAIFLTGGALRYAEEPDQIIKRYLKQRPTKLIPDENTPIYMDEHYIFASLGVLSRIYPQETKALIKQTMKKMGEF